MASKKTLISTSALAAVLAVPLTMAGFTLGAQAQSAPDATQTEQVAPDQATPKTGKHGHRGKMIDRVFSEFDANGDGTVDRAEFEKVRDDRFAAVDANKDGKIDRGEFRKQRHEMRQEWRAKRSERMLERLDADKDGAVSLDEFLAGPKKRFEKLDANGDGKIDKAEIAASAEKMKERMEKRWERFKERHAEKNAGSDKAGDNTEARRGHRHGHHGKRHGWGAGKVFSKLDTDNDKTVSRAEFDKGLDKVFDMADANKDGKVERSEVEGAVSLWHQKHDKDRD